MPPTEGSCAPSVLRSTGSPSDAPPVSHNESPIYILEGDVQSGWTTADSDPAAPSTEVPDVKVFTFDEISLLCSDIGLSEEIIEGILSQILVQHFSTADWIVYPQMKKYVWNRDPAVSKIRIAPIGTWQEIAASRLPAIIYASLGVQTSRLSIGDQFYQSKTDYSEGYARMGQGMHRIMCIDESDASSSLLATEVERYLMEFGPRMIKDLNFSNWEVVSRESPKLFKELANRVGTGLILSYSWFYQWSLVPAGPPLKSIGSLP